MAANWIVLRIIDNKLKGRYGAMTDRQKKFYKKTVKILIKAKCDNPIKMLAPLVQNLNCTQYQKFLGHVNSCKSYTMSYSDESGGYTDGCLIINFFFDKAKSKKYCIEFTSDLVGEYGREWWIPYINITVTQEVGSANWRGTEEDYLKFEREFNEMILRNDSEINKLKEEIAVKQKQLAKLMD